jgi:predicted amino acid-binding ACT domain protein
MINLIPPTAKKSIVIEYWIRVASVWMFLVSTALFAGAVLLFPVYVLVSSQVDAKESAVTIASQKVDSFENVSGELELASQLAKHALRESSLVHMSVYMERFIELQGPDIELDNIEISRVDRLISPVQVVGVATDRRSLAAFRDRLLAEAQILEVDLPIANLANDRNIRFTLTILIDNESSL